MQSSGAVYLKSRGGLRVPNSPYGVVLMVPVDIKQHLKKMKQTKQKQLKSETGGGRRRHVSICIYVGKCLGRWGGWCARTHKHIHTHTHTHTHTRDTQARTRAHTHTHTKCPGQVVYRCIECMFRGKWRGKKKIQTEAPLIYFVSFIPNLTRSAGVGLSFQTLVGSQTIKSLYASTMKSYFFTTIFFHITRANLLRVIYWKRILHRVYWLLDSIGPTASPQRKEGTVQNGDPSQRGPKIPGGGRGRLYLKLHCHQQNDSCIKMGSDESHFNAFRH